MSIKSNLRHIPQEIMYYIDLYIERKIFLPKVQKERKHLEFDPFVIDHNKYDEAIKQFLYLRKKKNNEELILIEIFLRIFQ